MTNTKTALTPDAYSLLELTLRKYALLWESEGADVAEVTSDLEAHIIADAEERGKPLNTQEVQALLTQMEIGVIAETIPDPVSVPATSETASKGREGRVRTWFRHWFWVALWPALVVFFELITRACGDQFFSPIPTWLHTGLLLVACAGGWLYFYSTQRREIGSPLVSLMRGICITVSCYWSFLMLPVVLLGTFAYFMGVVFSAGLAILGIPIFMICVLGAGAPLLLAKGVLRAEPDKERWESLRQPKVIFGMLTGLVLVALLEVPPLVTQYGIAHNKPQLIRDFGSEKFLLKLANQQDGWSGEQRDTTEQLVNILSGRVFSTTFFSWFSVNRESQKKHRELYYRVTGQAYNEVGYVPRASKLATVRGLDSNLGGDGVFSVVENLDLSSSRMDGHIDQATGLGYWEWTQTFQNSGLDPKEARMQILLPPGGVVSRLTLWVNGEPQEAAFSSTAKVAEAYKSIAVVRRQDPVLVRWVASDRILVQCFPVPVGGDMKIRVGITAPLDKAQRLYVPRIIEQNFQTLERVQTALWVQGDVPLTMDGISGKGESGKWRELHGKLPTKSMSEGHHYVQSLGKPNHAPVWTHDPFAPQDQQTLIRTIVPSPGGAIDSETIVMVVDGSEGNQAWQDSLLQGVRALEEQGHSVHLVVAGNDEVKSGIEALESCKFIGGQDNLSALVLAAEIAQAEQADYVIWCHGIQPVVIGEVDSLLQFIERGLRQPKFITADLAGGANRLLEELSKELAVSDQIRPSSPALLADALCSLFEPETHTVSWQLLPASAPAPSGQKVWDQLARWHTWSKLQKTNPDPMLCDKMAKYQLVTPVSGAVVLESQEQYQEFDLSQVDPDTVPEIPNTPEPSSLLLILLGATATLMQRRRR